MNASALQLVELHKRFGETPIIRGVNLDVRQGERHAVIGPNGAGKSTLFHLISGRFPVSSGQVLLKGEDITGLAPFMINRRGLSRSFQVTPKRVASRDGQAGFSDFARAVEVKDYGVCGCHAQRLQKKGGCS